MIDYLFPTKIYSVDLLKKEKNSYLSSLKKEILRISAYDKEGQKWSQKNYYKGYTSYGSTKEGLDQLHHFSSSFFELKQKIDKHIYLFSKELDFNIPNKSLVISKLWINIMPNSVIHTGHIHPLSVISGTFYVDIPGKNGPALKFEDPRFPMMMAVPPKKENPKKDNLNFYNFIPTPGKLVLFESWLRHEVNQNTHSKPRISVSFNYDWI
ncbi:MAG: TIGR02466 family protein [Bdellovibrionaceae bacterium]|nr:TIGR02466 family protein [Pseudobdellovibrionaceae bacterium]NUM58204.1 hypothetical protein [Pseudobdellovibrionaceae bacterium]